MNLKRIPFTKMQALGNDFVVIDATKMPFVLTAEQIQQMADRHRGVGFDQMLVLESPRDKASDFYYRIFNADGGEVGQCGNGARCVALYSKKMGLIDSDTIVLQTQQTRMECRLLPDDQVAVQTGVPKFDAADVPFEPNQPASTDVEFSVVNVGNPHAVILVDDVDEADLADWGELLAEDARFPEGVNVSVMSVDSPAHIKLRVYERGVGETEACGSAACAAMVLGFQQGLVNNKALVSQPGGDLEISWQGADSSVEMTGPAEFVFQGQYFLL